MDFAQRDGQSYVVAFTKNQSEAERKDALAELVAKEPTAEEKPSLMQQMKNLGLKQGDEGKTPPSAVGTYKTGRKSLYTL